MALLPYQPIQHIFIPTRVFYVYKAYGYKPGGCVDVSQRQLLSTDHRAISPMAWWMAANHCRFNSMRLHKTGYHLYGIIMTAAQVTPDSVVTHTYTIPGMYNPKMILVDTNGCMVPVVGPDTIKVSGAVANFGFLNQVHCDEALIVFSDSSVTDFDAIITYAGISGTVILLQHKILYIIIHLPVCIIQNS